MRILLISDLHANFPALEAISRRLPPASFDLILNGGDSLVYGPFPNETVDWLRSNQALSILGNTDRQVISLLQGKTFKKPGKAEKRIMYGWTAAELSPKNRQWLLEQPETRTIGEPGSGSVNNFPAGFLTMYHGSPADRDEFLFATTPPCRYRELAQLVPTPLATVGHSHQQFHIRNGGVEFINPGSSGRMFDGRIKGGCAVIEVRGNRFHVSLYRIAYDVEAVAAEIKRQRLPRIYIEMYRRGRKLN
jgi:predicted phosphodiesterase